MDGRLVQDTPMAMKNKTDIFEKCFKFKAAKELQEAGVYPFFRIIESAQDPEVVMNGKRMIMVGSNNYLGLTNHPKVKEAAVEAVKKYGTGCAGSRFLNGTLDLHVNLEEKLARFMRKEAALVFSTGFQVNLGVISALVGKKEFMKELNEVFFSMTYSGDAIGLAAAKATINELMNKPVIGHIWEMGRLLHEGINGAAERAGVKLRITGKPPRGGISIKNENGEEDLLLKSLFLQETVKRGVLFGGPVFTTFSHGADDIKKTIDASSEAIKVLKAALESGEAASFLEGEPVGVVFRQRN